MFLAVTISVPDLTVVLGIKFAFGLIVLFALIRETFTYFDERKRQDEVNAEFHRLTSLVLIGTAIWAAYYLLKGIVLVKTNYTLPF